MQGRTWNFESVFVFLLRRKEKVLLPQKNVLPPDSMMDWKIMVENKERKEWVFETSQDEFLQCSIKKQYWYQPPTTYFNLHKSIGSGRVWSQICQCALGINFCLSPSQSVAVIFPHFQFWSCRKPDVCSVFKLRFFRNKLDEPRYSLGASPCSERRGVGLKSRLQLFKPFFFLRGCKSKELEGLSDRHLESYFSLVKNWPHDFLLSSRGLCIYNGLKERRVTQLLRTTQGKGNL